MNLTVSGSVIFHRECMVASTTSTHFAIISNQGIRYDNFPEMIGSGGLGGPVEV